MRKGVETMRKDQRGMTLIELVVVMLIAVILMGIAGSLLMVSTQYYRDIVVSDTDKQSLDAISDLMRSDLLYASEIEIQEDPKTEAGWEYYYISEQSNGRLYRNETTEHLYSSSFYNNRHLLVKTRAYEDYRMDLTLAYIDDQGETVYQTSQTMVLPNIKIKADQGADVLHPTEMTNETTGYYIYYRMGESIIEEQYGGTIADQLLCKEQDEHSRDMGNYDELANKNELKQGDFVYILNAFGEKEWYRFLLASGVSHARPGSSDGYWKRITSDEVQSGSNYFRGDIIYYTNQKGYKQAFVYTFDQPLYSSGGNKDISTNTSGYYSPVYPNTYKQPFCDITSTSGEGINYTYIIGSPYAKLYEAGIILEQANVTKNTEAITIPSSKQGIASELNVVMDENKELWINISDTPQPANTAGSVQAGNLNWQKLQVYWDKKSAYQTGDIVMVGNDTFIALKDVTKVSDQVEPSKEKNNPKTWMWVRYDPQEQTWVRVYG